MFPVDIRQDAVHAETLRPYPRPEGVYRNDGPGICHIDPDEGRKLVQPEGVSNQDTQHGMEAEERRHADKNAEGKGKGKSVRAFLDLEQKKDFVS